MDLQLVLQKTKKKVDRSKKIVMISSKIATDDRPYDSHFDHSKTVNKLSTNHQQTDNKSDNELSTNYQQTDHKKRIKNNKLITNYPQTALTTDNKSDSVSITNCQQSDDKLITKTTFSMLVGLQRVCLIFLYQSCKANRQKITEQMSIQHIADHLKTSAKVTKMTINRLIEKGCLMRASFKNGRGGWSIYEVPEIVFTEMLRQETDNKLITDYPQTGNKLPSQLITQPITNHLSSSILNIKTTTTKIPPEFENINIESLADINFTENHLLQIIERTDLSPEMIQDSIDAFAFDLAANKITFKKTPLHFLMGTLRNGPYITSSSNYESPKERRLRLYMDQKRVQAEKIEKRRAQILTEAFEEWRQNELDALENKEALMEEMWSKIPREMGKEAREHMLTIQLATYYKEHVWPHVKHHFIE